MIINRNAVAGSLNADPTAPLSHFQEKWKIDLGSWTALFSLEELEQTLSKCVPLNYGEVYHSQRACITPFAAGSTLGASCWKVQAKTKESCILLGNRVSSQNWRGCSSFSSSVMLSDSKCTQIDAFVLMNFQKHPTTDQ